MKEKKTSKEWYSTILSCIKIVIPKGWDEDNYEYSFNEEKNIQTRVQESIICFYI